MKNKLLITLCFLLIFTAGCSGWKTEFLGVVESAEVVPAQGWGSCTTWKLHLTNGIETYMPAYGENTFVAPGDSIFSIFQPAADGKVIITK